MPIKSASAALMSILAVAVFLAGCQEEAAPPAQQKPTVGVVTLQAEPFAVTTELPGRTRAYRIAEVRPQVNGIIQKRLFTEGSEVKAGQQLYQIDAAVYEATLKSAQASLASSKSLADRYAELVKDQAVSKQAYDEARAASLQAEAELERARIDLRYTKVLAPISGRIGRSAVTEGALVSNGQAQELATIQQLDPIYVDVTQPARDLLGRPAPAETFQHRTAQAGLPFEARARPAPRSHLLLGIAGLVADLNARITVQLPRDR